MPSHVAYSLSVNLSIITLADISHEQMSKIQIINEQEGTVRLKWIAHFQHNT